MEIGTYTPIESTYTIIDSVSEVRESLHKESDIRLKEDELLHGEVKCVDCKIDDYDKNMKGHINNLYDLTRDNTGIIEKNSIYYKLALIISIINTIGIIALFVLR